jgi:antitoxin component YwqK of YwqJK toxin-antitoxin module
MDSTEQQELFLIKKISNMKYKLIILTILALIAGCKENNEQPAGSTEFMSINSADQKLQSRDRILYYDQLLFTGKITEINGKDTVSTSEYKNGKLNGKQVTYFKNGRVNEERYYENGNKTGEHKGWWESGNIKFIYHFKNDVFEGNVKVWNEKGMLFNDYNYVNGKEEGLQKAWFPNGEIQANYVVKENRKYGITGVKDCKTVITN